MNNKLNISAIAALSAVLFSSAHADFKDTTCAVQVAVSTPPVGAEENVAFNVAGDNGAIRAITLKGLSAPQTTENVPCSESPNEMYNITATVYSTTSNRALEFTPWMGQCKLTAGSVSLYGSNSIVSVVFPYDFTCA